MMLLQRKEQQAILNGAPSAEFAVAETGLSLEKSGEGGEASNQFHETKK